MRRSKAFSGKQKKVQLQAKKQKKQHHSGQNLRTYHESTDSDEQGEKDESCIVKEEGKSFFQSHTIQGRGGNKGDFGRYDLMFRPESKEEIEKLKEDARKPINKVQEDYLECSLEDFFTQEYDFPIRPPWDYKLSGQQLEINERRYFNEYLSKIDKNFDKEDLSYFELNLETWRQFWRVLEMSDVLLCIIDIRFPSLLFPPKLYDYVVKKLGKSLVLVLNKIDLCPAELVVAWKDYFTNKYPELDIICFTSFPDYNLHGNLEQKGLKSKKKRGKQKMAAEGALEVFKVCDKIVNGQVNIDKWKEKILEEMNTEETDEENDLEIAGSIDIGKQETGFYEFQKFNEGILTIGTIGQPNVGKSSLINGLMGKKVVSVSKTPGHTKHFQTIFLTRNVRLVDCPGLVFPSKVPKSLQVLSGSFPIAQLRNPFLTLKYLGERLDLIKILKITHPDAEDGEFVKWSAFDIADAWAMKKGFFTAKASRPDGYRAANQILRIALDGRICLNLTPPNYTSNKEKWKSDPRITEIEYIQAKSGEKKPVTILSDIELSEDEEEMAEIKVDEKKVKKIGAAGDMSDDYEEERGSDNSDTDVIKSNKFSLLSFDQDD